MLENINSSMLMRFFRIFCTALKFLHHAAEAFCHVHAENRMQLKHHVGDSCYENPKMSKLESVLLNQFRPGGESRGILFSKTRKSTHCLCDWVSTSSTLQQAGIKAAILTGAGNGIDTMTHVCAHKHSRCRSQNQSMRVCLTPACFSPR